MTTKRKKMGRPSRGEREVVTLRLPIKLLETLDAKAREIGLTRQDTATKLLEAGLALPAAKWDGANFFNAAHPAS